MPASLEHLDTELIEAIARRVVDLIGETGLEADGLRRRFGGPPGGDTTDPVEEMVTPEEAGILMRHSAKSVRKLCRLDRGDPRYLRHLRKGAEILIRRSDIADWIGRQIGAE